MAAAAAPGISPSDLSIGQLVNIEARTWSFINKPGGTAKITHIHYDANHVPRSVDVQYSLGGRETNLELTYVKMYVEVSRSSRSRKQDVKMNVDTLGGQHSHQQQEEGPKKSEGKIGSDASIEKEKKKKSSMEEGGKEVSSTAKKKHKRKALASIDRNQSQTTNIGTTDRGVQVESIERASESTVVSQLTLLQQVGMPVERGEEAGIRDVEDENSKGLKAKDDDDKCTTKSKTHTTLQYESKKSKLKAKTADGLGGTEANGKWELIQDGKITDYINTLQKGQRTSYWWSDEDGWLKGNISKGLKRVVTTSTIKWTITVAFDNGDKHTLSFHPHDKRWKIFKPNNTVSPSSTAMASSAVKENPRKNSTVSMKQQPASKKSTKRAEKSDASSKAFKSVGRKSVTSATTAKTVDEERDVGKETCASNKKSKVVDKDKPAAKSSSSNSSVSKSSLTSKPKVYKQLSLSFGLQMQTQKIYEVSANILTTQNAVAVKPVWSEAPESRFSTEGYGSSLHPPNTLTSDDTENKPRQIKSKSGSSQHGIGQPIGSLGKGAVRDVVSKAKGAERDGKDTAHNDVITDRIIQDDDGKEVSTNNDASHKSTTKRKAHTSIDRNHSGAHESKKLKVVIDEKMDDTNTDGEWSLIQDGKITDSINTLQKGQRISYWWSDEDGWLKGNISKGLKRVVTTSTIKWTITVAFDNGDKHTLSFHPHGKRWKVFKPNKTESSSSTTTSLVVENDQRKNKSLSMKQQPASTKKSAESNSVASTKTRKSSSLATDEPKKVEASVPSTKTKKSSTLATDALKKICAVKQPAPVETSKPVREESVDDSEATTKKVKPNRTVVVEYKESAISLEKFSLSKSTSTSKPKEHKQLSLSFGFQLQSKVQDVASKMHATNNSVKAENAATVEKCFSTERVTHCSSLPPETLSSVGAKQKHAQCAARDVTSQTSHSSAQSKLNSSSTKTSNSSIQSSTSLPAPGQTVLQTLYKKECGKANEFVDYMTAPTKTNSRRDRVAPSSPGSEDEHGLVLILDQDREDQFNSLLSEIMFNQRLDQMDVDDILERMNERSKSCKPFTVLEVKPFLQKLHRDNRIFMVEEEGKNGVVYAI